MAYALVENGTTVLPPVWDGSIPNPVILPNGDHVWCALQGWTSQDGVYSILPAQYDAAPDNSAETGRSYSIDNGLVQITRTWRTLPTPIPESVTNAQARALLMQTPSPVNQDKMLFDDIDAYCKGQGGIMLMAWDWVNEFTRDGTMVQQVLKGHFGMTDSQIDQMFISASSINF